MAIIRCSVVGFYPVSSYNVDSFGEVPKLFTFYRGVYRDRCGIFGEHASRMRGHDAVGWPRMLRYL